LFPVSEKTNREEREKKNQTDNMAADPRQEEADVAKPRPEHTEHATYTPNMELIESAVQASDHEATLGRKELFRRYWPAAVYSMLLSLALVMEGMDVGLVNNFFAHDAYLRRFGWPDKDGKQHIPTKWQGAIGAANQCGSIVGLLLNGFLQSRYGSRKVYLVSLHSHPLILIGFSRQDPLLTPFSRPVRHVPHGRHYLCPLLLH
jgi:hypothetical protein